jgi:choline-sulfatase
MEASNVLFIFSDEHDPRYMGCSGHPLVRTPNLDRLAARGTRFANAYTPSPICVPARASVATGAYVHQTGYWDNAIAYDGRYRSWGHRLQAQRMRVESIGKLHYRNETDPTGFDQQHIPMHIADGVGLIWASVRDPLPSTFRRSTLFDELGPGWSKYNKYDQSITNLAVPWLEERAANPDGKPWMLSLGYVAPHMPLVVPQKYLDLYPWDQIPVPSKQLPSDGFQRHPWVEQLARHWDHDAALGTDQRRRMAVACYLGLITYLDDQVGILLEALERTGLAANTRIVYSSDHGDNLGTRGLWNKSTLYRESTSVPVIVAGPDVPQGKVCHTNVNLVDLYPTFLEAMGVPPLAEERELPGRSLWQIAAEPDDAQRIAFSEYHALGSPSAAFMLVQGKYKYHYYVGFRPELFDLASDPEELNDLAEQPEFQPVLARFEALLRERLDPEAVDRRAKDDQNALVAAHGGADAVTTMGNQGPTSVPEQYLKV